MPAEKYGLKSAVFASVDGEENQQDSHLAGLLAWHGRPHVDGGPPGAEGWGGHVGLKGGPGEDDPGLGLRAAVRRRRRSRRGGGGCVGTSGGGGGVGRGAVARRGGLWRHWRPGGGGSAGGDGSSVLADLLHEIAHEVGREGTWWRQTATNQD